MPERGIDLSGQWDGQFAYPADQGPVTPFLARISQRGNAISGSIIEPDLHFPGASAEATIVGILAGMAVDFTKTYRRATWGYRNPVDYVGQVLDDGDRIAGMWSLMEMNGSFEMVRHAAREEAAEKVAEAEIEV